MFHPANWPVHVADSLFCSCYSTVSVLQSQPVTQHPSIRKFIHPSSALSQLVTWSFLIHLFQAQPKTLNAIKKQTANKIFAIHLTLE